jgi:hypothetical protein
MMHGRKGTSAKCATGAGQLAVIAGRKQQSPRMYGFEEGTICN